MMRIQSPTGLAIWTFTCAILAAPITVQSQNVATTVQLPTFGVAIDADGVLRVDAFPDPTGRLKAERLAAARKRLAADAMKLAPLRKVSLVKLQQALQDRLDKGLTPTDEMLHLAGLQRVEYVFLYPDKPELILAGPAEGWLPDGSGRVVGITTGKPVVLLEDLMVALRAYAPGGPRRPFLGCTINPDPEGLQKLVRFQSSIPRSISQRQRAATAVHVERGLRESLGLSEIQVFGVSPRTHFAQVLIEADYRMKMIGIGLERPPVRMTTFLGALSRPQHMMLQRWWFTPDYESARISEDGLSLQLVGDGVQLRAEDKLIGADGALAPTGAKTGKASELFTLSFTRKYDDIARTRPIYAQLRNMINVSIAAAFIRKQGFYDRSGWSLGCLADEDQLPVETLDLPKKVPCVVNVVWKGNRLLAPAGGVSIRADQALDPDHIATDRDGVLTAKRGDIETDAASWWWD